MLGIVTLQLSVFITYMVRSTAGSPCVALVGMKPIGGLRKTARG